MTLVPVTKSLSVIAKLEAESPEAARMLLMLGLYESLHDQIEANRDWLEPALAVEVAKINAVAREGLMRYSVSKALSTGELVGEAEAAYLQMVDDYIVSKDLWGSTKARWSKLHPRGADGRFVRVGTFTPTGPNQETTQHSSHRDVKAKVEEMKAKKAIKDDTQMILHLRSVDARGQMFAPEVEASEEIRTTPKTLDEDLARMGPAHAVTGVSVQRKHLKNMSPKEQAALDIGGMLTGRDLNANREMQDRIREAGFTGRQDANATQWNAPSAGGPQQDRQAYRRMQLTGQALSAVATPGSLTSVAGGAMQLAGEIGPEAEKVLGPGIRRVAYRYRGTERRPDKQMVHQTKVARRVAEGKADNERASTNSAYAAGSYWNDPQFTDDQREMGAIGDAVAARMLGVDGQRPMIPDQKLAEISRASGEVPPSQGVMVDADGDVVSQAVGYNGDHYLPFDLRNLSELNGGQYIRTRTLGGPTSEDIYTGLMTGTRQLQVVSNSGVFTLEFDPDLRGGRRFGDKARKMVSRYEEMLSAIGDEKSRLFERDLPKAKMTEIRREAAEASDTEDEFKERFDRLVARERMRGTMVNEDDDTAILAEATRRADERIGEDYKNVGVNDMPKTKQWMAQIRGDYISEEMDKLGAGGVRRLQLDGAGYDRAMKALQQEFPYFIRRAEWESLPDWHRSRGMRNTHSHARVGAKDSGHVQPGQTNPAIGLTGANERRKIGQVGQTRTAEVETETTTKRPGELVTTGGVKPLAGDKKMPTKADLMAPTSKFRTELDRAADRLVDAAAGISPQGGALAADGNPDSEPPMIQLNFWASRARENASGAGREGRAFVDWLTTKATPAQRVAIKKALTKLPAIAMRSDEYDDDAAVLVEPAYNTFIEMLDAIDPHVDPGSDPPEMVEPVPEDPKPPRFTDLPDVFADAQTHEMTRKKMEADDEYAKKAFKKLEGMDSPQRAEEVRELYRTYQSGPDMGPDVTEKRRKKLVGAQRAWHVLHTAEKAEYLRQYTGGGAAPLASGAAPTTQPMGFGTTKKRLDPAATLSKSSGTSRPHRVIVHKVDDPFSRRTRALLGIPEPSSA